MIGNDSRDNSRILFFLLDFSDKMDSMTTFIAIYGAVISTLLLIWNLLKHYLDNRSHVLVNASYAILSDPIETILKLGITLVNKGKNSVKIVSLGLKLENGEYLFFIDSQLPFNLEKGDDKHIFRDLREIKELKFKPVFVWIRDSMGNEYKSKNLLKNEALSEEFD